MSTILTYLSTLTLTEWIGVTGFVVYITTFAAVQFRILDGNSALFSIGNVLAACLVAVSLTTAFNLASALIQGSWITIGLVGLALRAAKFHGTRASSFDATPGIGAKQ